jgi:two-component system response regulator NreC
MPQPETPTMDAGSPKASGDAGHRTVLGTGEAKRPLRVALSDGQALVRSGVQRLLEEEGDIVVVSTSTSFDETARHLRGHRPDVLVYDPTGHDGGELYAEAIAELLAASPGTAIVVLSGMRDAEMARTALRGGATGFVAKAEEPGALVEAVHRAAVGEPYVNGRLAVDMARLEAAEEADGLTGRETEILRLIALGHTNAEIAGMLFLSIRTVESHRARILEKLRLGSRAELVQYAFERHLIP